jgi:EAL domain-containing protein (putative c-di-GMP-specific phosphodiesterase class I)
MDREVRTRVTLSGELARGIAAGQLFLLYQLKIDCQSGQIVGVEALVRWRHPTRGVLTPSAFVATAERSGLVVTLDRWALREACHQARLWLDRGIDLQAMAVNVSAAQFKRGSEMADDVAAALAATGLPPSVLELEVTETVLMETSRKNNELLVGLKQRGIRLAIDDFGTGYSSLEYLRRFPVDRLKIAQEFVRDIVRDPTSAAVAKAAIALGRELGMTVIAEGVEDAEQFALLKGWGCSEIQGFFGCRPLTAEDMELLLRAGSIGLAALRPAQAASAA